MLASSGVATRLPAQNMERARAFYAERLGLEPVEERPGGLPLKRRTGALAKPTTVVCGRGIGSSDDSNSNKRLDGNLHCLYPHPISRCRRRCWPMTSFVPENSACRRIPPSSDSRAG